MKFGKSLEESAKEPQRGGGGAFMKYMKEGDNTLRILEEPSSWIAYWEHYNPGGYSFPCTNETDCPGCTSDNEKMQKPSKKIAFNAFDGEYTNVYKIPKTVSDKLENRYERLGTVTDRDYIITKTKNSAGKVDYDVEGQDKIPLAKDTLASCKSNMANVEDLLLQAYNDAWGSSEVVERTKAKAKQQEAVEASEKQRAAISSEPPPFEEKEPEPKVISEVSLREMSPDELRELCISEGFGKVPSGVKTVDAIVDWMMSI